MSASATRSRWLLVYDGQCPFCVQCVRLVRRLDRAGRVEPVPLQDLASLPGAPGLSTAALERAIHLVSPAGSVFAGAEAAPPLLRLLPAGAVLAAPFAAPGVARVAAAAYRWVARRRHRFGCTSPACRRGD